MLLVGTLLDYGEFVLHRIIFLIQDFCRNSWDHMPVLLQGWLFFLLLLLDHPFIRCWFCCMSCLSQVMILQVILLVLMKPQHFSDGEQDSADFWTLSLHLAEYIFFHSLVVVPILLKMTQVSLTDFSQFWHSKIQTSPHYICFHYFDVPLLKTNTWHFHTSITFNYIQLLHTSTTQNTSTINTMKHFSDAGLKPLWQQGLASIALHAHPVVPQHRGKRPLARRLRCRREELEKLSLQKNGKSNKRQHFNTKNGWVL